MKYSVYAFAIATVLFASFAQAATLTLTDKLTAYHAASPAERKAAIPLVLVAVNDENRFARVKTDSEIGAEILPCMDSVDEQVSDDVRATQPVLDLAAVCLSQLGYKK